MYIKRHAEAIIQQLSKMFGAILVAGPSVRDIRAFGILDKIPNIQRGSGGVICLYDNLITLKDKDRVIPIKYL